MNKEINKLLKQYKQYKLNIIINTNNICIKVLKRIEINVYNNIIKELHNLVSFNNNPISEVEKIFIINNYKRI